jgi:hypothetical protein
LRYNRLESTFLGWTSVLRIHSFSGIPKGLMIT